jgi:chromosome partitioning protein
VGDRIAELEGQRFGLGLGVTEFAREGRASEEIRELWRWVLKKLVEGSFDHEKNENQAVS